MSSSRDSPFSFSPDVRLALGPPDRLNCEVRSAFPVLFDRDYAPSRAALPYLSERVGPRVGVRPGASIPAGTLIGLFSGHIFEGAEGRDARSVGLPSFSLHGVDLHLRVDGAARSSRFPSPVEAALYSHTCSEATVVGTWWTSGSVPCLLAHTARRLTPLDHLTWNFDSHSSGGYTSSHAEARAWRRAGHSTSRCSCNAPRDCPRDRFIRIADSADSSTSDDERD